MTRRLGWRLLKKRDVLQACVKCVGIRPGEAIERLGLVRLLTVERERLYMLMRDEAYGREEARLEGFPHLTGKQFVEMFCKHMSPLHGCASEVTRIEFEYVD